MELDEIRTQVNNVFTPSAPIQSKDLFLGRLDQISKLVDTIVEPGQHAILYGERGVGKTSLANVISDFIGNTSLYTEKVTCNRSDNFKSLWEKMFRKMVFTINEQTIGYVSGNKEKIVSFTNYLPNQDNISPSDIASALALLPMHSLLIFDEFDTIKCSKTRASFADLIKDLSDNIVKVTLMIVGIGDSVIKLIGEHKSVERCLKQILIPKMSDDELISIIENGLSILEMTISEEVKRKIVKLSMNFPHYTHLISKYSVIGAIRNKEFQISEIQLLYSLNEAVTNANQSIKTAYQNAIVSSQKDSKFEDVIKACALAQSDQFDLFTTSEIVKQYNTLTGKSVIAQGLVYNLGKLCQEERGSIIEKVGKGKNVKFRFSSPLVKVYVRLKIEQIKSNA